ncbi:MAG: proline--tRNA ligase [Acidimicrobiales bacterium]
MAPAAVLTSQSENFPRWYQDVVAKAELADNGPVRGTMVIRPYGYAIWERMQTELDLRIKQTGTKNAYFPLFIPESYLSKEADHVEGFSPELAVVTHAGGEELAEPIVVRPTSETIINAFIAKWVQSYRDLPLKVNQWANVVRWEMRPRVFLRTTEFLWQEGHTAHASQAEATDFALRILTDVYRDFMESVMAVPVLAGLKTPAETFPGADRSWTCEGMMRDGKALQMGTSHELGQRFAKMFGIEFQSESGTNEFAWQTSWGSSTRLVGAAIMAHGDDSGLQIAPRLAPVQVAVVLVKADADAGAVASRVTAALTDAGHRVELDDRTDTGYGRRVVDWELKGVPVRIEVGPRDVARGVVTLVRRDTGEKAEVAIDEVAVRTASALENAQHDMFENAKQFLENHISDVKTVDEAIEAAKTGFARMSASALADGGEEELAQKAVTVRCLLRYDGGLPDSREDPDNIAVVGRSY